MGYSRYRKSIGRGSLIMDDTESLSFDRKYRPSTLAKYIGNEKVKETVMKFLSSGKKPQLISLYGASGCGKTTMARLIAKEYSCIDRDPETGACGKCAYCQAIDSYITTGDTSALTNIQEIDITDQNGKNDLEGVLNDMMIPSFGGEWKIYILDEVHVATKALQNRMLKIAEEPPENVLMMLCTTNPEALLPTLKNRCRIELNIQKPKVRELAGLLRYVCDTEGVDYDLRGLEFIANRGELTIRTSLLNLEQVIMEQNSCTYESATKVFTAVASTLIVTFFKALKSHDVLGYVTLIYDIKSRMPLNVFVTEVTEFIKRGIYTINGIKLDGVADSELAVYRSLFAEMGVAEISFLLDRLLHLSSRNLETDLLTLGYTGIEPYGGGIQSAEVVVETQQNEVQLESRHSDKVVASRKADEQVAGVEKASDRMEGVGIETILALGGVAVK